eukprot:240952-Rhodomonas_salina.1
MPTPTHEQSDSQHHSRSLFRDVSLTRETARDDEEKCAGAEKDKVGGPEDLKVIYSGKVLDNDKTFE